MYFRIKNFLSLKSLKDRFFTTIILLSTLAFLFWSGPFILSIFLIFLFAGLLYELKKNYLQEVSLRHIILISIFPILLFIFFVLEKENIKLQYFPFSNFKLFLSTSLLLSLILFYSRKNIYYLIISFLVVCSLFSFIQILLNYNGLYIFFYVVILVTAMDVFAYLGGNLFGNIKIAPTISEGKTIEGTVIGLVFTVLISCFFKEILLFDVWDASLFGFVVGILAFFGDLLESSFKRKLGIKDSGSLFPGHGGLLDRFDGYLLVLPLLMFYLNYIV